MPNIFGPGTYAVDPAIVYSGGSQIADWWDGASIYSVRSSRTTPYPVTPDFDLEIA